MVENKSYDFEVEVYCTLSFGVEAPDFEKAKEMFGEYLRNNPMLKEIHSSGDVLDYDVYCRMAGTNDEAFADRELPVEIDDDEVDDRIYIIA